MFRVASKSSYSMPGALRTYGAEAPPKDEVETVVGGSLLEEELPLAEGLPAGRVREIGLDDPGETRDPERFAHRKCTRLRMKSIT